MRYLLSLLIIILPYTVMAAPTDVTTSSSIVDGEAITITGSSFGTKTTAAPIKFDNFESYTEGGNILNSGTLPQWTNTGSASGHPEVDDTRSISGSQAVYSDFIHEGALNDGDCNFVHGDLTFADTDELFTSYWIYWYNLTGVDADQPRADFFKLNRFNSGVAYSGAPFMKPQVWVDYGIPEALATPRGYAYFQVGSDDEYFIYKTPGGESNDFTHGSWHRLDIYVKLSTPAGATNGEYSYVLDGEEMDMDLDSGNPLITRPLGATGDYDIYQLNMAGCGYATDDHPFMWQDDIYIDNTRARVEMCVGATWANRGLCHVQPATAWAATSITATVNIGDKSVDDGMYLYVVDENGAVNENGYGVTIGETPSNITCYPDLDNDLYPGTGSESVATCSTNWYESSHFTSMSNDCDDTDEDINPGLGNCGSVIGGNSSFQNIGTGASQIRFR